jgi:hypothetical protein
MSARLFGVVEAIFVSGMILGGLIITFRPKIFKMKEIHKTMYPMVISIIIMVFSTYLAGSNKFVVLGLYSIGGLGIMLSLSLSNIMSLTYIQQEVKEDMLGKVSAFSTAVATASIAPGQLIYGQLIDINLSLYNILILTFIFSIGVIMFIKWNVRKI